MSWITITVFQLVSLQDLSSKQSILHMISRLSVSYPERKGSSQESLGVETAGIQTHQITSLALFPSFENEKVGLDQQFLNFISKYLILRY